MRLTSFAFLALLGVAHVGHAFDELLAQPLSVFRDQPNRMLGYLLFILLLTAGSFLIAMSIKLNRELDQFVFGMAGLLLLIVAATPSWGGLHCVSSFILLGLLYLYYAFLLYQSQHPLLFLHLLFPLAWLVITQFHSYGIWQKGLIVYLLIILNIHHHLLAGRMSEADFRDYSSGETRRRKRIFKLEPGKCWRLRNPKIQI